MIIWLPLFEIDTAPDWTSDIEPEVPLSETTRGSDDCTGAEMITACPAPEPITTAPDPTNCTVPDV